MTRIRGTQRDVIYDANKWDEPLLLDYSSTVTNKAPDPATGGEGGWNGILDLMTGDKIEWTCDVNNTTDGTPASPTTPTPARCASSTPKR